MRFASMSGTTTCTGPIDRLAPQCRFDHGPKPLILIGSNDS